MPGVANKSNRNTFQSLLAPRSSSIQRLIGCWLWQSLKNGGAPGFRGSSLWWNLANWVFALIRVNATVKDDYPLLLIEAIFSPAISWRLDLSQVQIWRMRSSKFYWMRLLKIRQLSRFDGDNSISSWPSRSGSAMQVLDDLLHNAEIFNQHAVLLNKVILAMRRAGKNMERFVPIPATPVPCNM